jgi:hypothetical protein
MSIKVPGDAAASDSSHSWILWVVNQVLVPLRQAFPPPTPLDDL